MNKLNEIFSREIGLGEIAQINEVPNQSILAAVGQGMCMTPGVSAILFSALAKANVNITAIAQGCSEYNITVVVDKVRPRACWVMLRVGFAILSTTKQRLR